MAMRALVLVLLTIGCSSNVEDGAGAAGGGGAPADPAPSVIVESVLGDRARIIVTSVPIDCSSGSVFDLTECGSFSVQVSFPAEFLREGPLIQSEEVTMLFSITSDGQPGPCIAFDGGGEGSQTVVIESLSEDTIEVRLSGFNLDLDGNGTVDAPIDGFHSGIRCDER